MLEKYLILKSNSNYYKVTIENFKINCAKRLPRNIQKPSSLVNIFLMVMINDLSYCIDRLRRFCIFSEVQFGFRVPNLKKKKKVLFGLKICIIKLEKYNLYLS